MHRAFCQLKKKLWWVHYYMYHRPFSMCRCSDLESEEQTINEIARPVTRSDKTYRSPYERAVVLIERLLCLPIIATTLYPILIDEKAKNKGKGYSFPIEPLRTLFQRGYTLNILLNELGSPFVKTVDLYERGRDGCYEEHQMRLFWVGCVDAELASPDVVERLDKRRFNIMTSDEDLEQLLSTVAHILNRLWKRGFLGESPDPRYMRPRDMYPSPVIIKDNPRYTALTAELSRTEVAYMHDLEKLQMFVESFRLTLRSATQIDDIEDMFSHINDLAKLHYKFSMGLEYLCSLPVHLQLFGLLFDDYCTKFENAYSNYCASRERVDKTHNGLANMFDRLGSATDIPFELSALLLRPVQRIAQYPLILQNILDAIYENCLVSSEAVVIERKPVLESIASAVRFTKRLLGRVNEATRRVHNKAIGEDFFLRVDGNRWKGPGELSPDTLGALLVSGQQVIAMDKEDEATFEIYLFETHLIICQTADEFGIAREPSIIHRTMSSMHLSVKSMVDKARKSNGSSSRRRVVPPMQDVAFSSTTIQLLPVQDRSGLGLISETATDSGIKVRPRNSVFGRNSSLFVQEKRSSDSIFKPLVICTDYSPTLLTEKNNSLFNSCTSLNTLSFSVEAEYGEMNRSAVPPETEDDTKLQALHVCEVIPISSVTQMSVSSDNDGTWKLSIQTIGSEKERMIAISQMNKESGKLWAKVLKKSVPLLPLAESKYYNKDGLFVNPRYSKSVLGYEINS